MATAAKSAEVFRQIEQMFGRVPEWARKMPDEVVGGFWDQMSRFELAETKIPNKYKELIGLAVAGATRCRYCALFHTEAARLFGATDDEIAEAAAMAGFTMMASTFINAAQVDYEQFHRETLEIVAFVRQQQQQQQRGQPGRAQPAEQRGRA